MPDKISSFNFLGSGIGSVPFKDVDDTCQNILKLFPEMPFWPQFVQLSPFEDMSIQYTEGLPLLDVEAEKRTIKISEKHDQESDLVTFYDHFLSQDLDYFAITKNYARGLYALLDLLENSNIEGPYIKGHSVGPLTFAAGITDLNGKSVLYNPDLLEALINGLAIKALWQVRALCQCGRRPVIFFDEPYLSGFGSAFSTLQRQDVINILRSVIDYLREHSNALLGVHCCGNTDWSMLIDAGFDIINFDAFEYLEYFLLYPDQIMTYLKAGGTIAWGIVPTSGLTGNETEDDLLTKLGKGLDKVRSWGIDADLLAERSFLTPACGMGTMEPEMAKKALKLLSGLSGKYCI